MICARCGAETGAACGADQCGECAADPRLDGRFRLDTLLGQGTHGMTYRAWDPEGGWVAVKMVNLGRGLAAERRATLDREVAVLRSIEHPRIPAVLDDFTVRSGMTRYRCIVQTFVDGPDLAAVVRERRPSLVDVLGWIAEIADVLHWLHGLAPPIIHRDIKPQNILRRRDDGALVLIDFGSVRDTIVETLGGTMGIGTAGYMAPEQITGDVSARSDVFSLGATAIELLIRRPPHDLRERSGRLVWPSEAFPAAVVRFIDRLVDPDPTQRPTAAQARDEARRLAADPYAEPAGGRPVLSLAKPVRRAAPPSPAPIPTPVRAEPTDAGPIDVTVVRAAGRARLGLGLLGLAAVVSAVTSPFVAEVTAFAGLFAAPASLVTLVLSLKAGVRNAAKVAGSALAVTLALFIAVNLLSIGPRDALAVFPFVLFPYLALAGAPWARAMVALSEARALPPSVDARALPQPALTPAVLHRRAQRAAKISGGAMLFAGLAALTDIESFMISGPIAVVMGLWLAWRGRAGGLRSVKLMGLSMPAAALALFAAIEVFDLSYWDNRAWMARLILAYGVAMALASVVVGFFRAPPDPPPAA